MGNTVDETGVDETRVDETGVDKKEYSGAPL